MVLTPFKQFFVGSYLSHRIIFRFILSCSYFILPKATWFFATFQIVFHLHLYIRKLQKDGYKKAKKVVKDFWVSEDADQTPASRNATRSLVRASSR